MRRFERLLTHRCTLILKGKVTGQDAYGRDVVEDIEHPETPCRADRIRESKSRDETGVDYVLDYMLFFSANLQEHVSLDMAVKDVVDEEGNPVLPGDFSIESFIPVYRRKALHHYEATLVRA